MHFSHSFDSFSPILGVRNQTDVYQNEIDKSNNRWSYSEGTICLLQAWKQSEKMPFREMAKIKAESVGNKQRTKESYSQFLEFFLRNQRFTWIERSIRDTIKARRTAQLGIRAFWKPEETQRETKISDEMESDKQKRKCFSLSSYFIFKFWRITITCSCVAV